jgi:2-polyprenyl-3-methyl-5-hydroxy-6-metoxy-1,4-benzoquinol methylase
MAAGTYAVSGIEPDRGMVRRAESRQWQVVSGYFPADLPVGFTTDILTFNDVFEHLPDPETTLAACREVISPNGLLVLNLPTSDGIFYQVGRWLARLGIRAPFDRLWQKDLPSPHLHYFRAANLCRLLSRSGFEVLEIGTLPSLTRDGLRERIAYAGGFGRAGRMLVFLGAMAALPLLRIAPGDIVYLIARHRPNSSHG